MASSALGFKNLGKLGKSAVVAATGILVSSTAYALYKYKEKMDAINRDEGFVDLGKAEEPAEKKVLMLGLDGAGKSSILQALSSKQQQQPLEEQQQQPQEEQQQEPRPTQGSNVLCLDKEIPPLAIWDIGGSEGMRRYWCNFIQDTCVLAYVVDSSEELRLPESYTELHKVLGDERLKRVPIVIIANKQDVSEALSPQQVLHSMGLDNVNPNERKVHCVGLSVPFNGLSTGVEELYKMLRKLTL